jgi:hypothetical protein
MKKIRITTDNIYWEADLYKTQTAEIIWDSLPFEGAANIWGEEIYFTVPLDIAQEGSAKEIVEIGELGFWPDGNAFCIFFGPTPVSSGNEPRAYSPVNVFGIISNNVAELKNVATGDLIKVEKIEGS